MNSLTKTNISKLTRPQAQMYALELLKALGLRTVVNEDHMLSNKIGNEYNIVIVDMHGKYVTSTSTQEGVISIIAFKSYSQLITELLNCIIAFYFSDDYVYPAAEICKNPYLGCKSLEEAMIRRDLYFQNEKEEYH